MIQPIALYNLQQSLTHKLHLFEVLRYNGSWKLSKDDYWNFDYADPSLTLHNLCLALVYDETEYEVRLLFLENWSKMLYWLWSCNIHNKRIDTRKVCVNIRVQDLKNYIDLNPIRSWWGVYRALQCVGYSKQAIHVKVTYLGEQDDIL